VPMHEPYRIIRDKQQSLYIMLMDSASLSTRHVIVHSDAYRTLVLIMARQWLIWASHFGILLSWRTVQGVINILDSYGANIYRTNADETMQRWTVAAWDA
jgi:hypothetical protein